MPKIPGQVTRRNLVEQLPTFKVPKRGEVHCIRPTSVSRLGGSVN